jgi:hypothetical protein
MEQEISTIMPEAIAFALIMGALLVALPRRYALMPLFISGCYMTLGQVLLVGPFHFSIFRIILLFGWLRILLRNEIGSIRLNSIDKVLLAWVAAGFILNLVQKDFSTEALVFRLGGAYNILGTYFLIRALVRDFDEAALMVKFVAVIIIPLAALFVVEYTTGRNMFSVFGGVSDLTIIRDGKLRCQGPFMHPILAGTFAATAAPLFIGLWKYGRGRRTLPLLASAAALVIVFCSSSSGPLIAYAAGMGGLFMWYFRSRMRAIRWGLVFGVVALQLVMKAPVWYLISRMGAVVGMGSGWHRSALIDAAIDHFGEWWLTGTSHTAHWMPTGLAIDPNNTDITNMFLSEGVGGGLLCMLLFIYLIAKCFKAVGSSVSDLDGFDRSSRFMIVSGARCSATSPLFFP